MARSLLLVATLLAVAAAPARTQEDAPLTAEAYEVLELLESEQFAAVHSRFSTVLADRLQEEDLAALWQDVLEDFGTFRRVRSSRTFVSGARTIALLNCQFEYAPLDIFLEYDIERRIAEIAFEPITLHAPPLITP